MDIPEQDWKQLRKIQAQALARFCDRVLADASRVIDDKQIGSHERYQKLLTLIQEQDEELAFIFNDSRRSIALQQITSMKSRGLFTAEEFEKFTPQTQEWVEGVLDRSKGNNAR